jgi:hypothetical protein
VTTIRFFTEKEAFFTKISKTPLVAMALWIGTALYSGASAQGCFYTNLASPNYYGNGYYDSYSYQPMDFYNRRHVGSHGGLHWTRDAGADTLANTEPTAGARTTSGSDGAS